MEESTKICSTCGRERAIDDFATNIDGILNKTCLRHSKKQCRPSNDTWEDFVLMIRSWNQPSQSFEQHKTNPVQWTCGCKSFLLSRFLLCKHLVHCFEDVVEPVDFFRNIRRQRVSPFWIAPQLVLRPEFKYLAPKVLDEVTSSESDSNVSEQVYSESHIEEEEHFDDSEDQSDDFSHQVSKSDVEEEFRTKMFTAMEYWDEQRARGHSKFVEEFMKKNKDNVTMVDEIQQLKDRRSMPKTWASNKNPLTMYYY